MMRSEMMLVSWLDDREWRPGGRGFESHRWAITLDSIELPMHAKWKVGIISGSHNEPMAPEATRGARPCGVANCVIAWRRMRNRHCYKKPLGVRALGLFHWCYHPAMDDYFTDFAAVISALDPKAADFSFQFANLRSSVQISGLLTDAEKKRLMNMLHIVQMQVKPV